MKWALWPLGGAGVVGADVEGPTGGWVGATARVTVGKDAGAVKVILVNKIVT